MPFRLPDDPEMASKVMEFRQTRMERILEAGVIGYLIGRGENRPAGIVVLVLFICFALIAVVLLLMLSVLPPIALVFSRTAVTVEQAVPASSARSMATRSEMDMNTPYVPKALT